MLTHTDIWTALDRLAVKFSMSASSLARQAGLDPTTFNKSKRYTQSGKPRWPSTESLSKVLNTLGVRFEDFAVLVQSVQGAHALGQSVPVIGLAQAGADGFFDGDGYPVGEGWDDIRMPGVADESVYALQISGDSMMPALRNGDRIIVVPNAQVYRGDRVVVKTKSGEVMAKELVRIDKHKIELMSINPDYPDREINMSEVQWVARIVWVTQ